MANRIAEAALHAGAMREIRRAATAGERVAIACSGGADSVALVMTLWAHVPEMRGRWLILHFDHALRGRASTDDARFVRALARGLGEECLVGRWNLVGLALPGRSEVARDLARTTSEADARDARFSFFARAMGEAGVRVLALGHQADDVIETMLMRLVRGSATGGLAAPRPLHWRADGSVRVRPLLEREAHELRAVLRDTNVPWREDATNAGDVFTRTRIRCAVLPALRAAAGRDLAKGFLEARRALEEDDEALEAWLKELAGSAGLAALRDRPRALARRAVQAWLQSSGAGGSMSRAAAAVLTDAVVDGSPTRQSAGPGRFIVFDGRRLALEKVPAADGSANWGVGVWLEAGHAAASLSGDRIEARLVRVTTRLRAEICGGKVSPATTVYLATDLRHFFIRQRKAGDRYRPLGAPGRVRLQDALVNRKIARELRDRLPVVTDASGRLLWVPGLPPAEELSVQQGTKLVVQLTYHLAESIVSPSRVLPTLSQDHVRA